MPARIYICDAKDADKLKKLMDYDPYLDKSLSDEQLSKLKDDAEASVIFARQDYKIKDGISLNMAEDKVYLYLSANDEFLQKAESKLIKNIESAKRADPDTEATIIKIIDEEVAASETGIGSIFG
jgi:hypothetical protein